MKRFCHGKVEMHHIKTFRAPSVYQSDEEIAVAPNPFNFRELSKTPMTNVEKIALSQISMMPMGTIFTINKDELIDLMAYLRSGGNPKDAVFGKK